VQKPLPVSTPKTIVTASQRHRRPSWEAMPEGGHGAQVLVGVPAAAATGTSIPEAGTLQAIRKWATLTKITGSHNRTRYGTFVPWMWY